MADAENGESPKKKKAQETEIRVCRLSFYYQLIRLTSNYRHIC